MEKSDQIVLQQIFQPKFYHLLIAILYNEVYESSTFVITCCINHMAFSMSKQQLVGTTGYLNINLTNLHT